MNFKPGDWVIHPEAEYPWQITQNSLDHLDNTILQLWQPKKGEWCWFYFSESVSDHNCLALGKFIGFRNKESNALFLEYYDTDNNIFASDMCEPFIGKLPSFIKDK